MKQFYLCLGLLLVGIIIPLEGVFAYNSDSLSHDLKTGVQLYRKGQYPEALAHLQAAEMEMQSLEVKDSLYARFYIETGLVAYLMGDLPASEGYYARAWERLSTAKGTFIKEEIDCLYRRGILARELGDLHLGLDYIEEAQGLAERSGKELEVGKCRNALGNLYNRIGRYEEGLIAFSEARAILAEAYGAEHPVISSILESMGKAYLGLDSLDQALAMGEKVLAIRVAKMGEDHPSVAITQHHLGDVYLAMGKPELASKAFTDAKMIWQTKLGPAHVNMAISAYKLGDVAAELGDYAGALLSYQDALDVLMGKYGVRLPQGDQAEVDPVSYVQYLEVLKRKARVLEAMDPQDGEQLKRAMQIYKILHAAICQMRVGFKREASRQELLSLSWKIYESAIALALKLSALEGKEWMREGLGFAEAAQGVLLEARLSGKQAMEFAGVPMELVERESKLRWEVMDWTHQLDQARQETGDGAAVDSLSEKRFHIRQALDALVDTFARQYPHYYQFKYAAQATDHPWKEHSLPEGTAVLKYFVGDQEVYGFACMGDQVSARKLGSKEDMDELTFPLRGALVERKSYQVLAQQLARQVLHPLLTKLKGDSVSRLVIMRDGSLANIPFDLLPVAGEESRLLIEAYPIAYGYSLESHFKPLNGKQTTGIYHGLGRSFSGNYSGNLAPLPNANWEVKQAQQTVGGEILLDDDATEVKFREMATSPGILHLATHALLDDGNPLYSRLALAPSGSGSKEDGWVHTYELFGMQMQADLAILNACNTGDGALQRGEGLLGLSTGFAFAGVPSIYMNHWEADDREGATLLTTFLENLKQGLTKDVALQQAKLSFLQEADEVSAHPYYWANPGLIGNTEVVTLEEKTDLRWMMWAGAGVVLLLLAVWWFLKRK